MTKLPIGFKIELSRANTDVIVWNEQPDKQRLATREEKILMLTLERTFEALNGCLYVDWMDEEVQARVEGVLPYIKTGDIEQLRQYVRKESGG